MTGALRHLVFATTNQGKLREVRQMLANKCQVDGLPEGLGEPVENGSSFADNALIKARYYQERLQVPLLAEDSGLVVDALNGEPGVHSARYGGEGLDDAGRNSLLLANLKNMENRAARYKAVMVFLEPGQEPVSFEGLMEGSITKAPSGEGGFGYDPVFLPAGKTRTAAALAPAEKHALSHRGRALARFWEWFKNRV